MALAGIGHNSGQIIAPGHSWRSHAWTKARAKLLPHLPIEVVRLRVKRAAELGLPYRTYAGVRASNGHDLIGFLFSSNALRIMRAGQDMPADRVAKLSALVATDRVALLARGVTTDAPQIDACYPAPEFTLSWSAMRSHLKQLAARHGSPADRFLLVGDTAFERDWAEAMGTAGYLPADSYFPPQPA